MDNVDERAQGLAMRIYVELVARNTEVSQDAVKLAASASNIAKLSLRLTEAFLEAEEAQKTEKAPATATALLGDDILKWSK